MLSLSQCLLPIPAQALLLGNKLDFFREKFLQSKVFGNFQGLFMEGGRWNRDTKSIDETLSGQFHDAVPVILISPTECSQSKQNEGISYEAPVFRTSSRQSFTIKSGHSSNFITFFKLNTVERPAMHWIFRGVALLCQLDD